MTETLRFNVDPDTGIVRTLHFDDETGACTIQTTQDVGGMLEDLARRRNEYDERTPWKGDLHHVGSIPLNVYYELRDKYRDKISGRVDKAAFAVASLKWLRENPKFTARPGRLI